MAHSSLVTKNRKPNMWSEHTSDSSSVTTALRTIKQLILPLYFELNAERTRDMSDVNTSATVVFLSSVRLTYARYMNSDLQYKSVKSKCTSIFINMRGRARVCYALACMRSLER